jgi:flagellar export protein FliJ
MANKTSFRLQPVLNYKSNLVDALEVEFSHLKQVHRQEANVLQQLQETKNQGMDALRRQQQGALDCETIRLHQQYLQALDTQVTQQTGRVEEAKGQANDKREELVKTMQDQKTLEKLRERHQVKQQRELLRREARVVDDLVVTRYKRER